MSKAANTPKWNSDEAVDARIRLLLEHEELHRKFSRLAKKSPWLIAEDVAINPSIKPKDT